MDSFNIQNYFKRGKTVVLTLRHGDEDGARQWSDKDTHDLLKLMNDFLPEFQSQVKRKKDVWDDLSKEFQNSGYGWTSEDCRKKWSNMIRTFKGIEEQKQDPTSTFRRVKWPFYDDMKQLLTQDGSDNYPEALSVVQILKGNVPNHHPLPSSTLRKTTVIETAEGHRFTASQRHHHLLRDSPVLQTITPTSFIVSDADVLGTDSQDALQSSAPLDTQTTLFSDVVTTTEPPLEPSPSANYSFFRSKSSPFKGGGRKRRRKGGEGKRGGKEEESTDDLFLKFMDTSQKQNEQMLAAMARFHDNALQMMQQRNTILSEVRDILLENRVTNMQQSGHESLNAENEDTLTLHMGPAYSTNPSVIGNAAEQSNVTVSAQLNTTLVMSDADPTATFQLDDGTNLEPFTETVIPEVSLLHPTLVSVGPGISNTGNPTANIADIAVSASLPMSLKRKIQREN